MIYIFSLLNYRHFFFLIMKALEYELSALKYPTKIVDNLTQMKLNNDDILILFGFQAMVKDSSIMELVKTHKTIVYNSEQLHVGWDSILNNLKDVDCVWDYSKENIKLLQKRGFNKVYHVPLGYSDTYLNDTDKYRDYTKIIFIGAENTRRTNILNTIEYPIVKYHNAFGKAYDEVLFNYGLFINIHFYSPAILEIFRIVPLLSNGCTVISERSMDSHLDSLYGEYITFFDNVSQIKDLIPKAIEKRLDLCEKFKKELTQKDILINSGCLEFLKV